MPQIIAGWAFTALAGAGVSVGTATVAANIIGSIGASLLYTAAANALLAGSGPNQPEVKRDLSLPTERPAYRFVYGHDLAMGTPAPVRQRGEYLIGCWILNSRPSALTDWTLYFDKREVAVTGDPFDFTDGGGAIGTTFPFIGSSGTEVCRIWFGRGDQTSPPEQITNEYPWASGADEELFKVTDACQGNTVMWAILRQGGADDLQERWPSWPPLVEVLADYSLVYDPRDVAQDPDDPDTWTYSDTLSLCILDAARQNPIRQYHTDNLLMDTFADAADIDEELVELKAGGTEKRYTIAGTLVWQDAEMEGQLIPLFAAGAARPIRMNGRLGIAPGAWIAPTYTLTDFLTGGASRVGTQAGTVPTQLRTSYTSPDRLYESAELEPYDIPGAQAMDGGLPTVRVLDLGFAGSPTQAQRVQKIEGGRARRQKRLKAIAPPSAFDLIGGATMTATLPDPFDRWDGIYELEVIHPAVDPAGESGVAMRCPFTAVLTTEDIFDWDKDVDEVEIDNEAFDGQITGVGKPENGTATGGAGQIVVTFDMPATGDFSAIEFYGADTNDIDDAELLATKNAVAGATKSYTETGLGSSVTRYYFARSKSSDGKRYSGFTASVSDTTDP
jgi:hypothetical protein